LHKELNLRFPKKKFIWQILSLQKTIMYDKIMSKLNDMAND